MRSLSTIALVLIVSPGLFAQTGSASVIPSPPYASALQENTAPAAPADGWTERKVVATLLSTIIPGAGQSYLGHTTKGALFTVGAFGSGLITVLSENNVVGRNERLDELRAEYERSVRYDTSDAIFQRMVETKTILDRDVKRRDLFLGLTAVLWVANMADMVFFTEDRGEKTFGTLIHRNGTTFALVPDLRNGINAVITHRF